MLRGTRFFLAALLALGLNLCIAVAAGAGPPADYAWREVDVPVVAAAPRGEGTAKRAEEFTKGLPVYVSLTTISSRLDKAADMVSRLFTGAVVPTCVYLFVSHEPWLIDEGIPEATLLANERLRAVRSTLSPQQFKVVYTNNLGPHRKLLPLLARKWTEDCVIVTMDDESGRRYPAAEGPEKLLAQLLRYYRLSDQSSVVALKVRRIGLCDESPHFVLSYHPWWGHVTAGRHEMLLLPTGTGGVLYRPRFFHPVVFDPVLGNMTAVGDDLLFRLATMIRGVKVVVGCHPMQTRYVRSAPPCPKGKESVMLFSRGELEASNVWKNGSTPASPEEEADTQSTPEQDRWRRGRRRLQGINQGVAAVDPPAPGGPGAGPGPGPGAGGAKGSLWASNRHGGNDRQWRSAVEQLQLRGLFNFSALVHEHLYKERAPCFAVAEGDDRPRLCMLKTCRSSRQRKDKDKDKDKDRDRDREKEEGQG